MRTRLGMATLAAALLLPGTAAAATVKVGSPLEGHFTPTKFKNVVTVANLALPEPGAQVTSPVTGAILAWRLSGASGGPFRLRVLSPLGGPYLGAGSSPPVRPSDPGPQRFPLAAAIPISAGDLIGLDNSNVGDQVGTLAGLPGASAASWLPRLADGASAAPESEAGREIALNAEVLPAPTLVRLSPASGSIAGGATVRIDGADLSAVTRVSFGGTAAHSFEAESESSLTAVAPEAKGPGSVNVSVTTVAGTTPVSVAASFTYEACVVPKLKKRRLKAAKKLVRTANCRVGKVHRRRGATAKAGRVVRQRPRPRTTVAPGTKVNVTLR